MNNCLANTNFLVSLKDIKEISNEILESIDILDLKNPSQGSIGSWETSKIKKAVALYKSQVKISATLGDIFCNEDFTKKIEQFDTFNLDFIKFGLLSKNTNHLFEKIDLVSLREFKTDLVCVVFVDKQVDLENVLHNLKFLKRKGINNILLDTFRKNNGDLLSYCDIFFLKNFITKCKKYQINIGLAGGVNERQLPSLIELRPSIIGLRSAVCSSNNRNLVIEKERVQKLSSYFNFCSIKATERAGA